MLDGAPAIIRKPFGASQLIEAMIQLAP